MGGRSLKKQFLVFLLVLSSAITEPTEATEQQEIHLHLEKWTIHVVNGLSNGQTLFEHCKSGDDDLGERNLSSGAEFNWSFRINIFETTLYWCFFRKPNGQSKSFNVFWVEKLPAWLNFKCSEFNCIWTAKDDGIYIRNNPDQTDVFVHKWE